MFEYQFIFDGTNEVVKVETELSPSKLETELLLAKARSNATLVCIDCANEKVFYFERSRYIAHYTKKIIDGDSTADST